MGVAAPRFSFPQDSRVWLPFGGQAAGQTVGLARLQDRSRSLRPPARCARRWRKFSLDRAVADRSGSTVVTRPLRQSMLGTKQGNMARFVLICRRMVPAHCAREPRRVAHGATRRPPPRDCASRGDRRRTQRFPRS